MNNLVTSRAVRPFPQSQPPSEVDRAYARLAAAIVDVPDEIILAILISKGSMPESGGLSISH